MTTEKVDEAILYAENDYPLMVHLEFDFYNTLVRKRTNGTWDRQKAVMLIAKYFVPRIVKNIKRIFNPMLFLAQLWQKKWKLQMHFLIVSGKMADVF